MRKVEVMEDVLFVVRVKLPSSSGFAPGPSGDCEYEEAYWNAINAVKPVGFEVRGRRSNERWPVDPDGFTWIPLFLSDEKAAIPHLLSEVARLKKRLSEFQDTIKKLL